MNGVLDVSLKKQKKKEKPTFRNLVLSLNNSKYEKIYFAHVFSVLFLQLWIHILYKHIKQAQLDFIIKSDNKKLTFNIIILIIDKI